MNRHVSVMRLRIAIAAALFMLVIAIAVISCDGIGFTGQILRQQSPAGIYTGIFQSTANMQSPNRMVTGVISKDFDSHLMIQDMVSQYAGVVSVEGDQLTGTLTEYLGARARFFGFGGVRSITLNGTVSQRDRLFGDYTGEDEGFFGLDYSAEYERGSSLDQTTGVRTFEMASSGGAIYNVTLDIAPDGLLFGTDTNGCVFSGSLGIIDERYNVYRVVVTMSSCDPVDGEYAGLAYRTDTAAGTSLFLFFANDSYAFSTKFSQ